MAMPGRKFTQGASSYRYSINGQEKDAELNENITTALYWEYDSRIGRRWNMDPKPNVSLSSYSCFAGNPIRLKDILGDTLPKNPYASVDFKVQEKIDPLKDHEPYVSKVKRPENAPVDRNSTFLTDVPFAESGGEALFGTHSPLTSLGSYTKNPGFDVFNMKTTLSGEMWNEYTESPNYFLFSGESTQKGFVNFMLGHYIHGTGPINYIFPVNGTISKYLVGSQIVNDAFTQWKKEGYKNSFESKIEFKLGRQAELFLENKILTVENFVGSANITINKLSASEIIMRIYNVTSLTSGDISKHLPGGTWKPSVVADPDNQSPQPYSNILQIYQLKFTQVNLPGRGNTWLVF